MSVNIERKRRRECVGYMNIREDWAHLLDRSVGKMNEEKGIEDKGR